MKKTSTRPTTSLLLLVLISTVVVHAFSSSPFHLLGIPPGSSQHDIKKAYGRKAKEVHPDMVPPNQREQASKAFRELYEAYEKAMDICINGFSDAFTSDTSSSSSSWRDTAATESIIKKTFVDICEELDRELEEWSKNKFQQCLDDVCNVWPDKEGCWQVVHPRLLPKDIDKLAEALTTSHPKLASFLTQRKAEYIRDMYARFEERLANNVKRVNELWPSCKAELKQWVMSNQIFCSDWNKIANLVENPTAAQNIRLWVKQRIDIFYLERAEKIKTSAEQIVQVFPDREKICSILKKFLPSQRQDVFDQLPDDIYKALCTQSWFSRLLK